MSSVQPPPKLQPHTVENGSSGGSSLSVSSSGSFTSPLPHENIAEILFRILSKLTIYQSLQESSSLVVTVRDDVSMMDACALFLPSSGRDAEYAPLSGSSHEAPGTDSVSRSVSLISIEVLESSSYTARSEPQSPESKARTLFGIAKDLRAHENDSPFSLLPDLVEDEAKNATRAAHQENPVGDFLTVRDLIFFTRFAFFDSIVPRTISVGSWIDLKRSTALKNTKAKDDSWLKFCTESTLVSRASVSLSHGAKENTFYSGSSMNMSVSNLLNVATGSRETSNLDMFAPRTGGSCLHAVSELLARPWQNSVPLSVSTEKGIHAIFGYTSLPQMMAHVAMNCSEQSLEPFFHTPIEFEDLNSETCITANSTTCTVAEAFEILAKTDGCDQLVLLDDDGAFDRMVLIDDLCEILARRLSETTLSSLETLLLSEELDSIESHCGNNVSVLSRESDFPITLSVLLQRLLLHSKSNCVIVLERDIREPVAIVSVRDVWNHVMKRNT